MSRSNPEVRLINPAKRFFEWNGDQGGFRYYDKDKKEKVNVPLPFTFLVLDQLVTVGGFSDAMQSGFWSNEIRKRDIKNGILKVRTKKGLVCEGSWNDIKGKEAGMDYCESVYIGFFDENKELVIGNIKMKGAAISAWFNYTNGEFDEKGKRLTEAHDPYKGAITVKTMLDGKKGKTEYKIPVFENKEIKPETEQLAVDLDAKLQEFLKAYFAQQPEEETASDAPAQAIEKESTTTFEPGIGDGRSAKDVVMAKNYEKADAKTAPDLDDLPF